MRRVEEKGTCPRVAVVPASPWSTDPPHRFTLDGRGRAKIGTQRSHAVSALVAVTPAGVGVRGSCCHRAARYFSLQKEPPWSPLRQPKRKVSLTNQLPDSPCASCSMPQPAIARQKPKRSRTNPRSQRTTHELRSVGFTATSARMASPQNAMWRRLKTQNASRRLTESLETRSPSQVGASPLRSVEKTS